MKKVSYKELLNMQGKSVIVKDLVWKDVGEQKCTVEIYYDRTIPQITLQNENYAYEFYTNGDCMDGEFEVYIDEYIKE